MWAFVSRRFRRWMLFTIGVPAAAWVLDRVGERLEARGGPSRLSRALQSGGAMLHRHERGPAARRGDRRATGRAATQSTEDDRPDRRGGAAVG